MAKKKTKGTEKPDPKKLPFWWNVGYVRKEAVYRCTVSFRYLTDCPDTEPLICAQVDSIVSQYQVNLVTHSTELTFISQDDEGVAALAAAKDFVSFARSRKDIALVKE